MQLHLTLIARLASVYRRSIADPWLSLAIDVATVARLDLILGLPTLITSNKRNCCFTTRSECGPRYEAAGAWRGREVYVSMESNS
jgi:hypothetical protein